MRVMFGLGNARTLPTPSPIAAAAPVFFPFQISPFCTCLLFRVSVIHVCFLHTQWCYSLANDNTAAPFYTLFKLFSTFAQLWCPNFFNFGKCEMLFGSRTTVNVKINSTKGILRPEYWRSKVSASCIQNMVDESVEQAGRQADLPEKGPTFACTVSGRDGKNVANKLHNLAGTIYTCNHI